MPETEHARSLPGSAVTSSRWVEGVWRAGRQAGKEGRTDQYTGAQQPALLLSELANYQYLPDRPAISHYVNAIKPTAIR